MGEYDHGQNAFEEMIIKVRLHIIRNARIQNTGKSQSCMAVTDVQQP